MTDSEDRLDAIGQLHGAVSHRCAQLAGEHRVRLNCERGCHDCCVDNLSVFEVEAERIRHEFADLLVSEAPHPGGKCAFLDQTGACRIYSARPYVCRSQGLPLRWLEEQDDGIFERRDICSLNEEGPDILTLEAEQCWTIGPTETHLRVLQCNHPSGDGARVGLRDLFVQTE